MFSFNREKRARHWISNNLKNHLCEETVMLMQIIEEQLGCKIEALTPKMNLFRDLKMDDTEPLEIRLALVEEGIDLLPEDYFSKTMSVADLVVTLSELSGEK